MSHLPETARIAERRAAILAAVERACKAAGRDPSSVTLIAVSKRQPDERLDEMLASGQRVFGENRVQEAEAHWAERAKDIEGFQLRLIGPLQTNKAEDAVALFDAIETLDRSKLASALSKAMEKLGKRPELFVQVNTGEEPQKSGVIPGELPGFLEQVRGEYGLEPVGLMCIPPVDEPPGPHFALLRKLAERAGLSQLSMGMSEDFETAIRFGATHVRVGSALFGPRED